MGDGCGQGLMAATRGWSLSQYLLVCNGHQRFGPPALCLDATGNVMCAPYSIPYAETGWVITTSGAGKFVPAMHELLRSGLHAIVTR